MGGRSCPGEDPSPDQSARPSRQADVWSSTGTAAFAAVRRMSSTCVDRGMSDDHCGVRLRVGSQGTTRSRLRRRHQSLSTPTQSSGGRYSTSTNAIRLSITSRMRKPSHPTSSSSSSGYQLRCRSKGYARRAVAPCRSSGRSRHRSRTSSERAVHLFGSQARFRRRELVRFGPGERVWATARRVWARLLPHLQATTPAMYARSPAGWRALSAALCG
jgi:hypothetical protein